MKKPIVITSAKVIDSHLVTIKQVEINPSRCPHCIFDSDHYRKDGSCRCNDINHTIMAVWGYKWKNGRWS